MAVAGQMDIFGNIVPEEQVKPKVVGRRKYLTMQEMHGVVDGKTCKTCKHCQHFYCVNKSVYKCDLWYMTHSEATDIRLKHQACKKYQEADK